MRSRPLTSFVLAAAAGASLLGGCASDDPYSASAEAPSRSGRTPVVAPAGPASPWWWLPPDGWWPFQ